MTFLGAYTAVNVICQPLVSRTRAWEKRRHKSVSACCRDLEAAAKLFDGEDNFHTAQVPGAGRELQRFIGHINVQTGAPGRSNLGPCNKNGQMSACAVDLNARGTQTSRRRPSWATTRLLL